MSEKLEIHAPPQALPGLLDQTKELVIRELHRRLGEEGHPQIRPGHGCVFRFIDLQGTRLTGLAERSGLTKQAIGEVVDDLEQMGYVERVPDPDDRRAKIIRLTDRGVEGQRTALRIFADIERRWGERFGAERVADMRELLTEIIDSEREQAAVSSPGLPAVGRASPPRRASYAANRRSASRASTP